MVKLASVQKILSIDPIPNADAIEKATVLGWEVVVKKDEFKVGDLVCYIQIDTVVPECEQFEFLRARKFRVRTIKLRGQISQGLIIPLSTDNWTEDDDLTDRVGVKKYEKDIQMRYEKERKPKIWYKKWIYLFKYNILYKLFPRLQRKNRSGFPTHLVSITDEERIQNIPQILDQYKGKTFITTYKLDGSSITIIHSKILVRSKFRICSRKFELHDKKNNWYRVFKSTNFSAEIIKLVKEFKTNDVIVQGEAIGKFNGNRHNLKSDEIRLFNIVIDGKRLNQKTVIEVCERLNIPHCPLYKLVELNHTLPQILEESDIPDIINPIIPSEGLVWRCIDDNFSFKVINNKYLMKYEE